jgi:hypothetical protein
MSFAVMPTFEGNRIGVRRFYTLRGMGDDLIDPLTGNLYSDETPQQQQDALSALAQAQAFAPASVSGGPQSPSGTRLSYTASWTAGFSNLLTSPNDVIASLSSQLPAYGMQLGAGSATASGPVTYGIQLAITDTVGHNLLTDAKGVLDSLLAKLVGNNMAGSNLVPIGSPQSGSVSMPASLPPGYTFNAQGQIVPTSTIPLVSSLPSSSQFTTWFETNWKWIAVAFGVLAIGPVLVKKF